MSTLGVITNPSAGSGRGAAVGAQALALLAADGHRIQDLSRGSWAASLDEARGAHAELDALVVVGGDGMVHLGVQACASSPLPLGVIAAGSGNDAATAWGLPVHNVPAAIAAIGRGLAGDVTRVDLGRVQGEGIADPTGTRYFAAVLSAGIDAAVSAYGNRLRFPRGPLKYKVATARELPRFRPYGVSLDVDGQRWEQACTLVAVANGPVFGGGLRISPQSSVTDGTIELLLAEPMSPLQIVRIFPRLARGTHLSDRRVRLISATHVRIGPAAVGAPLPAAFADGELVGAAPFEISVAPAALSVLGAAPASVET